MEVDYNNITTDNCQQLESGEFKQRFTLMEVYYDRYTRPYFDTTDLKTGKRAIVREYFYD